MAFIRPYKETDFAACANICIATLPPSLSSSPEAARLLPYLWTHQYTLLPPSTSHVLDDGSDAAVGYCIVCPDVFAFVSAYPRYTTSILARDVAKPAQLATREPWTITSTSVMGESIVNPVALAQLAYRADRILLEGKKALTSRWRATMHIDLLGPWQGKGWGRQLIERFVQSVRESGADYDEGEHIGIAGENAKVVRFYENVGFRVSEGGEEEGSIWMVRKT
ncbi:Uu.00g120440.m01.CDS01 [Anthostomella pinea]|uniref:Uu.00g120440.m01.CDS01 n=1 Tax=Anthostomella pinea TaxID=933095 RepID=A0AAI8YH46_9PEZI|nr:Uu.00g120440.m01.CDS01 [Anthostomella pinea]